MVLVHDTRWDLSIKTAGSSRSPLSIIKFKIDEVLQVGRYEYDTWVVISIKLRVTASEQRRHHRQGVAPEQFPKQAI